MLRKLHWFIIYILINTLSYGQDHYREYVRDLTLELKTIENDSIKSILFCKASDKAAMLELRKDQSKYADSAYYYAKLSSNSILKVKSLLLKVNSAIAIQDTTTAFHYLRLGHKIARDDQIDLLNEDYLRLRVRDIQYQLRQGKLTSEVALNHFLELYEQLKQTNDYALTTEVIGRIALIYLNRKELGKALHYNHLELEFAKKSEAPAEVAAAMITELDIVYHLLSRPIQSEDVLPLIRKAEAAEHYMQSHSILDILPFAKLYLAKFRLHETQYKKAEDLLLSLNDSLPVRVVFSKYEQLCEIAKSTNAFDKYRLYTLKFKPLAYQTKRPFVALNVHNYLLDFSLKQQLKDSSLFYANALETNLKQVDTTQFLDYLNFSYNVLSKYYESIDKDKSLLYKTHANTINQHIIDFQKEAFADIIKYKNEVETLEHQNSDLKSNVSFFRDNLLTLALISILLLFLVFYFFRAYKKSDQKVQDVVDLKNKIVEQVERKHIILNNKQKIYLEDICYIKSDRNYVEYYLTNKKVIDRNKLSVIAEQLPPNFVQVHRSYLVNKNHIKSISATSLNIAPSTTIPISRTYKKNII